MYPESVNFVRSSDWLRGAKLTSEQTIRLTILDYDILSAQIAIDDFRRTKAVLNSCDPGDELAIAIGRAIHHAKGFVCAMRRIARVLEFMSSTRGVFPEPVATVVKSVWRKKKTMFESYITARDAIEHIDGETSPRPIWFVLTLVNDRLVVNKGKEAEVSDVNLRSALEARNEIVAALVREVS